MNNNECNSALVLADGRVFYGLSCGFPIRTIDEIESITTEQCFNNSCFAQGVGELVFNTSMTGYVEVITDPSFFGQIVCMTYPHIGNYGVDERWSESGVGALRSKAMLCGFVMHQLYDGHVPKGRITLGAWLKHEKIPAIENIDTRSLTLHLRETGAQNSAMVSIASCVSPQIVIERTLAYLNTLPSMEGQNLLDHVGQKKPYVYVSSKNASSKEEAYDDNNAVAGIQKTHAKSKAVKKIALYDCGCKHTIVKMFSRFHCEVTLLPHTTLSTTIIEGTFDMLLISNGPGDPAALKQQITCIQSLVGNIPLRGICLGNQILAHALGAQTYKMRFGHHGINHPVKDLSTGKLYITSQNHGFAVAAHTLPEGVKAWFVNTNDGTLEGFMHFKKNIYSVQFHPEAAPGPHDSAWIFEAFLRTL